MNCAKNVQIEPVVQIVLVEYLVSIFMAGLHIKDNPVSNVIHKLMTHINTICF